MLIFVRTQGARGRTGALPRATGPLLASLVVRAAPIRPEGPKSTRREGQDNDFLAPGGLADRASWWGGVARDHFVWRVSRPSHLHHRLTRTRTILRSWRLLAQQPGRLDRARPWRSDARLDHARNDAPPAPKTFQWTRWTSRGGSVRPYPKKASHRDFLGDIVVFDRLPDYYPHRPTIHILNGVTSTGRDPQLNLFWPSFSGRVRSLDALQALADKRLTLVDAHESSRRLDAVRGAFEVVA